MDFADLTSPARSTYLPRRLIQSSRWIFAALFALLILSYIYLQPRTLAPSEVLSTDQIQDDTLKADSTEASMPSQTPELLSATTLQSGGSVDQSTTPVVKPDGVRIVGVVFYGRRDRASLLECYLRQNLASNGGWLDEVIWAANTDVEDDLTYGKEITKKEAEYTYMPIPKIGYLSVYSTVFKEPDTIYVKIDDDVVFVDKNAIPRLVMTLMNNPQALLVSSNIVNNPALGWLHYHIGAVHPYVPEVVPEIESLSTKENGVWRASKLPSWNESEWQMPDLFRFNDVFGVNSFQNVPKHRWIPTRNRTFLYQTPIALSQYDAWGNNLRQWSLAAQAHYSLLQNIEEQRLGRYSAVYGSGEEAVSTWDMLGTRLSINFIAVKGADIIDNMDSLAKSDDENVLTESLPRELHRTVLVETTSVVAHFAFGAQKDLINTDILERYHNYAAEMICPNSLLEPETILASAGT